MKRIITLLLLFPLFSFSQKPNAGYFQIGADLGLSKPLGPGFGGSIMAGHLLGNFGSIGAGFDVISYKNIEKPRSSVYADLRYNMGVGMKSKPLIYFSLTPGYSFYNDAMRSGNYTYTYGGGFLIGAGLGCLFYSGRNTAPFLSVMYNRFPTKLKGSDGGGLTTTYDIAKITFGIKF